MAVGIVIGMPGPYELVVPLGKELGKSVKKEPITDESRKRICKKIDAALREFRKNGEAVVTLCHQDRNDVARIISNDRVRARRLRSSNAVRS